MFQIQIEQSSNHKEVQIVPMLMKYICFDKEVKIN